MLAVKVGLPFDHQMILIPDSLGILSAEDDEYRWAGVEDPKVIVTTSHDPSSKLKQFSKVDRQITGHLRDRLLFLCLGTQSFNSQFSTDQSR